MWRIVNETSLVSANSLDRAMRATRALLARKDLGFLQLPQREALWTTSDARGRELRKQAQRLVLLGMGGSSLGGRALLQGVQKYEPSHEVTFLDNVDSDRFWKWLRSRCDLDQTHWAIASKSGNTIETLTMAEMIDQHLRAGGFRKLSVQSTSISENADNPLMRWTRKEGVPWLEIPKDVGGRYSVLSPVGLLPAAFYGLDLAKLRSGAQWALGEEELVARLTAQTLASFDRGEWITQFWAYSDGLREFGLWMQQLWAESLGKAVDRKGAPAPRASSPMAAVGSSDQHSILQQAMEGARDKFLWFLRVDASESAGPKIERNLFDCQNLMNGKGMGDLFGAMASATQQALAERNVQSLTLRTEKIDEAGMGALFMLSELVVGAVGEALDIDAFNQPGVEAGKIIARGLLEDGR